LINRFVVSEAILQCLHLIWACFSWKRSELYAVNTDGIYITNPKLKLRKKKEVIFDVKHIDKALIADSELHYFEKHLRKYDI